MTRIAQRWARYAGALALLIVPGSCVAPAAEKAVSRAATTAAAVPVATVAPPAALRTDFLLNGEARQGGTLLGRAPDRLANLTLDGRAIAVTGDGSFLIAFDRDAATAAHLVATLTDGRQVERYLLVAAGQWRIEAVDAPFTGSAGSSAEFERRRPAELAQINAARQIGAASEGWRQRFIWPVTGRQSGFFGSQRIYRGTPGSYHSGSDVAVAAGTPFVAPADGVVVLAASSPFTLEGNLLIVDHGMGLTSAFLHCARLDVRQGDRVAQGQMLGTVGQTGRATGPHLHWGMKWRDARIDPSRLAGAMIR